MQSELVGGIAGRGAAGTAGSSSAADDSQYVDYLDRQAQDEAEHAAMLRQLVAIEKVCPLP